MYRLPFRQDIFVYNIKIIPPWSRPYRGSDRQLYLTVFLEWKRLCPAVNNQHAWVYNGGDIVYSTQEISSIPDVEGIIIHGETKERVACDIILLALSGSELV